MKARFKDHFSGHAPLYSRYRPTYPEALFDFLAQAAPARSLAWDCATGGGQAAAALAGAFERVVATDASPQQLAQANPNPHVEYRVAPAESSGLEGESVDLITVAQALHWFDLNGFYAEARRVLKPHGLLVVWCYNHCTIAPELDARIRHFYAETVGPYWPAERRMIEQGYRSLPFPFDEVDAPEFVMSHDWRLDDLAGYLGTWSAVHEFIAARREDPVPALMSTLAAQWGDVERRQVTWVLDLRVGRRGPVGT